MIGGQDIRVQVPSGATALDFAVRAVRLRWPAAVFVADNKPDVIPRYDDLEFHDTSEVIVYKDLAACEAWRELGYDESLKGTMVYLISDPTDLTIVIEDDPSPEIRSLVSEIKTGLAAVFRGRVSEAAA